MKFYGEVAQESTVQILVAIRFKIRIFDSLVLVRILCT